MQDVACEQKARVAEHQAEQPNDPAGAGVVGEVDHEACEVDLGLDTRRGLKAHLVGLRSVLRSDRGQEALYRRIGTRVAELANLSGQARRAQIREGDHPLAQKFHERGELARPPNRPRSVNRRLNAAFNVFAHRLRITTRPPRDRGDPTALVDAVPGSSSVLQVEPSAPPPPREGWHRCRFNPSAGARPG
jgi:hypothetical protein